MTRAGASLVRLGLTEPWAEDTLTQLGWWAGTAPRRARSRSCGRSPAAPTPSLALRARRAARRRRCPTAGRSTPRCAREVGLRGRLLALLGSSTMLADHLALHPDRWHRLRDDHAAARRRGRPARRLLAAVGADPDAPPAGVAGWRRRDGHRFGGRPGPAHRVPRRAAGARRRRPRRRLRARAARAGRGGRGAPGCRTSRARRCGPRWPSPSPRPSTTRRTTPAGSRSSRWASAAAAS